MVRWEIWVTDECDSDGKPINWRFNACFDDKARAATELEWYDKRGYLWDLRCRTTRYQRNEHITTGKPKKLG